MNNTHKIFKEIDGLWVAVDSACQTPPILSEEIEYKTKKNKIIKYITRYSIFRDGKSVENNIKGWRTALAHARKWQQDLFYNVRKVEILNLWTGEIVTLQEAERRAKLYAQKPYKGAVIGDTT